MSDSFATAPRLDPTTLTLRIYPKVPRPPTILRSLRLLPSPLPFTPPSFLVLPLARSHPIPSYLDQPTNQPPSATPVACGACFPIPHSTLIVARTPGEKVTSRNRVSQDPANPSWYKIAPSDSQRRRFRNAETDTSTRNWDSTDLQKEMSVAGGTFD